MPHLSRTPGEPCSWCRRTSPRITLRADPQVGRTYTSAYCDSCYDALASGEPIPDTPERRAWLALQMRRAGRPVIGPVREELESRAIVRRLR